MKTNVFITVDTEFSIAGAFADPIKNKPASRSSVLCEQKGRSLGLGYLLDSLCQHGLKATFFTEVLNVNYFGYEPMSEIVDILKSKKQDIQLHIHPCWTYFKNPSWKQTLINNPPNDNICTRSQQEMEDILFEALETFVHWDIPKPLALRTGSLYVNLDVYRAMQSVGIKYASNIGVGIFKPKEEMLQLYSGFHEIEGCYELPILTYKDIEYKGRQHLKTLTITGSSWGEMQYLLLKARQKKITNLVILTHPFEFIKHQDSAYTNFMINRMNRHRFLKLCGFLKNHQDDFQVKTFSDLPNLIKSYEPSNTLLSMPIKHTIRRILENKIYDRMRFY